MPEPFLEEQLKRIREMTEQVSRLRPLYHDLLNYSPELNGAEREEQVPVRKGPARDSSRRRGR